MAEQAQKDKFVAALTELGGSAGNGRLREALQWDEAAYNAVKDELVAEGVVTPGRVLSDKPKKSRIAPYPDMDQAAQS